MKLRLFCFNQLPAILRFSTMTSDKQVKRWSLRAALLLSFLLFIVAFLWFTYVTGKLRMATQQAKTSKMIAAQEIIRARYVPSPELIKSAKDPKNPCAWITNGELLSCNGQNRCWQVNCALDFTSGRANRNIVASWLVDSQTLADTPDAGAKKLFIRNPQ